MKLTDTTVEISLRDGPRHSVDCRVPRRLWAEESSSFVGDFVLVSISDRSIDDPVPRSTTVGVGWSLSDRIDDPLGRFVADGGNSVPMPSFGLPAQLQILIEAFDDLRIEAEELWRAERNADSVAGIGASWGCVGAQFADSRGELVAQWSEHFRHSASPVTPVDDDGLLQIDWPTPAAGSHPLAVDLILATATQAQSKRPTIADIANARATQAHGYERYFIENIRAGIHTTKDEAVGDQ